MLSPLLALSAAASMIPADAPHRVAFDHRGHSVEARYRPIVTRRLRQIGMAAPGGRAGSERCLWTATLSVERQVRHAGTPLTGLGRTLPDATGFSGSRPGSCAAAGRAIDREIAARAADAGEAVRRLAARDRPQLLAELDVAVTSRN